MWILSPELPANVAKTELNKFIRKINELTTFSRCVHLSVIPLTTQNTFDFTCWDATLLGLARLRIISRRAKFCSLLSQFFRVFQFFSEALTRPDSRHCSVLFNLVSLALTRLNPWQCSVFKSISPPFLPWAAAALSRSLSPHFRLSSLALCRSLPCCASDKLNLKR